ncbi:hypothetical protein GUITHDRAFT_84668 [Guillardia theta CCMP2712]|uniref:Uncharacterized protein n=1 Tax=Guillardia theta (strain CCMP2712) TaxID=905079 RepID=L1JWH9_GUITC|nr:hypothetical protein GUITHDRAFT_84668 [Guillardia theta CCMP2712]EKX52689.1 hypothetical protein GUITHDRAFT_84668 [Guillardia theta CCMP2712]|eukprot:XP_005839669.1 hypothetical protein GUITHDRAFT_84668 [Guillardia theta CCMP2712]
MRTVAGPGVQAFVLFCATARMSANGSQYYRKDGVRIVHDPYSPGMADKYGAPGETDSDGFDPYADTVGPGIYGGKVKRDAQGKVLIGRQYQNHNPRPGPIYSGEGYTEMSRALSSGPEAVKKLLELDPSLVHEISTGGATPLHMAGMSRKNQLSTELLIASGGNIEAEDTYGYRPLHRMASNNLDIGAEALLKAGADGAARTQSGETPLSIARQSSAKGVISVLNKYGFS